MTATTNVTELKTALTNVTAEIEAGLANAVKIDGANVEIKAEDYTRLRELHGKADELKTLIGMSRLPAETKAFMTEPTATAAALALQQGLTTPEEIKTLGEMFTSSDEFKDMRARGRVESQPMEVKGINNIAESGSYGVKDVYSAMNTSGTAKPFGRTQIEPMIRRQYRQFRVRDLFPSANTDAALIEYFKAEGYVGGDTTGNKARSIRERAASDGVSAGNAVFGLKPQTTLKFSSANSPVRTIAHWEAAHRNVLDDEPQLRSIIDTELMYGLRLEEDRQILKGSGANDELLGLLNTPGIQAYTQQAAAAGPPAIAAEPKSDALRRAATRVLVANYQSTGFILNPFDWEDIELQKGTGDGQYMLFTNIAVGAETRVWRQPVVETIAMDEGKFLTGAFGLGAKLYDRQVANIRTAEQHADFFVRNAIVILAEERLALTVQRPEAFVYGTFTS
jgi:hypothetical protein